MNQDVTAKARIRDAAIASIARHGVPGTTVRKVAEEAGVSPGLVIHHYQSMEGLRKACNDFIADRIRSGKESALDAGPQLDVMGALRETDSGPLIAYLARVLTEDTPEVDELVDHLIEDSVDYLQHGVDSGMLRPSADPKARAALLILWNLGTLALHRHIARIFGVDLTSPDLAAQPEITAYFSPIFEFYTQGLLSDEFAEQMRTALDQTDESETES